MGNGSRISPNALAGSITLVAMLIAGGSAALAAPAGEYAEADACLACHEEMGGTLAGTPHGQKAFGMKSELACQACHGPAAAHVDDPDAVELRPRLSGEDPREVAETCQTCHAGGGHMFWQGGRHADAGVTCTDCHSVHAPVSAHGQLKAATEMETCFACHKNVRADSMRSSHHPVREGKITCSDCHEPHGTPNDNNIDAASVNDKCFECHAEKRGPFLWEHAPVREDCLTCHTPHGSNHQKLQRTSVPYLCQQCHSNTRHPGTLYDASQLPGAAAGSNRVFERACLNCHPAIHGSNHPSGPYLGR